jgi:uncharacterized protein with NAD-binding domain and iron-sulfur cluster
MKIAIVGSGISGLAVAHRLRGQADITLYEAGSHFGGHTHTVDVTLPGPAGDVACGVDTGFLVFNERTYPNLIRLLAELGVETAPSDMSFSVQVPQALGGGRTLEWSGTSLSTVFAQRGNLVNPRFLGMLRDLLRFNKLCTRIAQKQAEAALMQPLGDFLREHRFGDAFVFVGAFSRESVDLLRWPGHRYASFNQARDDFARDLDARSVFKQAGKVALGNAMNDAEVTTGDHDGMAVVVRAGPPLYKLPSP